MTREEAIKYIKSRCIGSTEERDGTQWSEAMWTAIEALEDIERWRTWSHTYDNLISRQDAIDALNKEYHGMLSDESMKIYQIKKWLSALPSADAVEVVRCKECKWHLNGHLCKQLSQYGSIETPPSFYCGFGERREP